MNLPTKQQAHDLIEKYSTSTKQHLYQVGCIMKYFAEKLWEDSHYWWLVGVLHDIDWDHIEKNGDEHMKWDFENIMAEIDAPAELLADIRSHWFFLDAYFRMIPSEDVMDIKPKSIKKKLKDKGFAAGVDREHTMNCETMLNIPLDEFIEDIKLALKGSDMQWVK